MALTHKQDIAKRFSRASADYYSLACIQKDIAAEARRALPDVRGRILDIGCATGEQTRLLGDITGQPVIGLDLAHGMVSDARRRSGHDGWVNADMDALPFSNHAFAHVFSSMALQWTQSPESVMAEIYRVLQNRGGATLLVPISGSFWQLAEAYRESGLTSRLNALIDAESWLAAARQVGFGVTNYTQFTKTDCRASLTALLRTISKIGAAASQQHASALTRSDLKMIEQHFPTSEHGFCLDYRCLLMSLEK